MSEPLSPADLMAALADPFEPAELKFKPQVVKDNRALGVAYVDARVVMDRLDDVFGVGGWQDEYTPLPGGEVMCRLSCKIGGEWVTKADVGGQSEQPDAGDREKAAVSDALKRAAVKFGIGRYLYRLQGWWLDYDPRKRQFTQVPALPPHALPAAMKPAAKSAPALPAADQGDAFEGEPMTAGGLHAAHAKANPKSLEAIATYREQLGFDKGKKAQDFHARLWTVYKVREVADLTQSQADEIIDTLRKAKIQKAEIR